MASIWDQLTKQQNMSSVETPLRRTLRRGYQQVSDAVAGPSTHGSQTLDDAFNMILDMLGGTPGQPSAGAGVLKPTTAFRYSPLRNTVEELIYRPKVSVGRPTFIKTDDYVNAMRAAGYERIKGAWTHPKTGDRILPGQFQKTADTINKNLPKDKQVSTFRTLDDFGITVGELPTRSLTPEEMDIWRRQLVERFSRR